MIDKILDLLPIVSCQEATRLASLKMERRLSIKEKIDLQLHLMVCDLCVSFNKHINGLRVILRSYTPQGEKQLSTDSKNQLKTAINNQLKQ